MVSNESPHVLRLVARRMVSEEYHPLRSVPLCILDEIGEVELELPAPPLREPVPDESILLRPEERDEDVPSPVAARGEYPLLDPLLHPLGFDARVERGPGLVLECDDGPFFASIEPVCFYCLTSLVL